MSDDYNPRVSPWLIDESEFYEIDDPHEQKEFLLRYAVLAPSGHNSQPWSFRVTEEGIEVFADYARRLPVSDPNDRELLISIGAAIANLRVAAAHFGFESTVLYAPEFDRSLPLALVSLRETCNPDPSLCHLFSAITRRRTSHASFEPREIDAETLERICDVVESSEMLRFVVPHDAPHVAELVELGDRALLADERWRKELAEWVRPNESGAVDGICGDAFGIPGPLAAFAPYLIATIDAGPARGRTDRQLAENAAGLIAVTSDDDRTSVLRAGETLERLLLTLTSLGVQYAFLNQPIEVPQLRGELWRILRTPQRPQLLLRIGYARPASRPMPRRPVTAVVT